MYHKVAILLQWNLVFMPPTSKGAGGIIYFLCRRVGFLVIPG